MFSFLSYEWGKRGKHPLRILYPCVLPYLVSVPHATGLSLGTYRYVTSGQHNVIFKMLISCRYLKITRFHIRIWNVNLSSKIKKWSHTEYTFTWEQAELSGNWPFPIEHEFWGVNTVPSCEEALASHVEKSCGKSCSSRHPSLGTRHVSKEAFGRLQPQPSSYKCMKTKERTSQMSPQPPKPRERKWLLQAFKF